MREGRVRARVKGRVSVRVKGSIRTRVRDTIEGIKEKKWRKLVENNP